MKDLPLTARNLKWLLEQKNTNPNELSDALKSAGTHVPQPTLFRILNGESRDPRTSSLRPIAVFFGVSVHHLREWDFEKHGWPGSSSDMPPVAKSTESARSPAIRKILLALDRADRDGRLSDDLTVAILKMIAAASPRATAQNSSVESGEGEPPATLDSIYRTQELIDNRENLKYHRDQMISELRGKKKEVEKREKRKKRSVPRARGDEWS